jgi:hypothetical protein
VTIGLGGAQKLERAFAVLQISRVFSCSQVMVYIELSVQNLYVGLRSFPNFIFSRGAFFFVRSRYRISWSHIITPSLDIPAFNNSSNCFFSSSVSIPTNRRRISLGNFAPSSVFPNHTVLIPLIAVSLAEVFRELI